MQIYQIVCPDCKKAVEAVKLDDGQVLCPHCNNLMFIYRMPNENFTPVTFTELLTTRGRDATNEAAKWFPQRGNKINRLSLIQAGIFVGWIWPQLAVIFKKEESPDAQ